MSTLIERPPSMRELVLNGIFAENPVFRLALSLCPAVAVTTTVMNGLMLGVAVVFVQVASSVTVALVRRWIHPRVRIPLYTIIISRLEVFASRMPLTLTFWDGLGMGLGFLFALLVIGAFRELLGNGSILGYALTREKPLLFFALPAGGFFSIALLMAFFNYVEQRRGKGVARPAAAGGAHG